LQNNTECKRLTDKTITENGEAAETMGLNANGVAFVVLASPAATVALAA
jgi:hypothetical protein